MSRLLLGTVPLILAASVAQAQTHAGHAASPPQSVPHAQHGPSARPGASPAPDPHAGHATPTPAPAPGTDPHAGHAMSSTPGPVDPDPQAGHIMPAQTPSGAGGDPHAGHGGHATAGVPDVPTSVDDAGRPPQPPPPSRALAGPPHAADAIFGAERMAAARSSLLVETGAMTTTTVVIDRLEAWSGDGEDGWLWDVGGWHGGDIHRFWWKSEGGGDFDGSADGEVQALYSRAIRPFWDVQAGVRQDFGEGLDTTHLVLGVQGLAPYWFEVDAAAFLSTRGDLTARVEAEYDQRITQRLILQPRFELEASASDIPELGLASGFTHAEAGIRLRYEFAREFAPYVGVEYSRDLGGTADLSRARGEEPGAVRWVVGLKAWF